MCGNMTQKVWRYGVAIWLVGEVTINQYNNVQFYRHDLAKPIQPTMTNNF